MIDYKGAPYIFKDYQVDNVELLIEIEDPTSELLCTRSINKVKYSVYQVEDPDYLVVTGIRTKGKNTTFVELCKLDIKLDNVVIEEIVIDNKTKINGCTNKSFTEVTVRVTTQDGRRSFDVNYF